MLAMLAMLSNESYCNAAMHYHGTSSLRTRNTIILILCRSTPGRRIYSVASVSTGQIAMEGLGLRHVNWGNAEGFVLAVIASGLTRSLVNTLSAMIYELDTKDQPPAQLEWSRLLTSKKTTQ
jgi:hypothetical protein